MALGLLSYWAFKIRAEINGASPISNFSDFVKAYGPNIALSLIGYALIVLNGPNLNFSFGDFHLNLGAINGVGPAFFVGGAIPSMMNNIGSALIKK